MIVIEDRVFSHRGFSTTTAEEELQLGTPHQNKESFKADAWHTPRYSAYAQPLQYRTPMSEQSDGSFQPRRS